MGWAFGQGRHPRTGAPRDIGYGVAARCDEPGCNRRIDRGLAFYCGDAGTAVDGGEHGCGGFYCGDHLFMQLCEARDRDDDNPRIARGEFCRRCADEIRKEHNRGCRQCRRAWAA